MKLQTHNVSDNPGWKECPDWFHYIKVSALCLMINCIVLNSLCFKMEEVFVSILFHILHQLGQTKARGYDSGTQYRAVLFGSANKETEWTSTQSNHC